MPTATADDAREAVAELDAVAWELERRGLMPPDFGAWIERARPEFRWDAEHFRVMRAVLDEVTAGDTLRALFNVAVRHGKTEHNTISYAAYRLDRDPSTRILLGTHGQHQARKLSREIKRLYKGRGGRVGAIDTVDEWETADGGGVRAFGAGAGTASVNADLIIIDDPIGSRADAESQAHRDRVWDWITGDILARSEPHTAALFSMPRWHEDDPAGRMRERQPDRWAVVDLPGEAEEDDPLGREPGEPLWPEERGREWLDLMRVDLGPYNWASLMQGRPRPREGGMFKWDWWQEVGAIPETGPLVRYWDTAGTAETGRNAPDYTAGALVGRLPDGRTAIVDIVRFREGLAARNARMERVAIQDRERYGGRVRWWIETETGIGGRERMAELLRRMQNTGLSVKADPRPTQDKTLRAEPLAAKTEAGNVALCPGEWRDTFRLEAADFPGGKHDDQVDAVVGADTKLALNPPSRTTYAPSPWG